MRPTFCLLLSLILSTTATAQVVRVGEEGEETPPIFKLTLSPADEPRPALKYRFLVPPVDQIKGNAATFYYKGMVFEGPDLWSWDGELAEKVIQWAGTPLDQLPQAEIWGKPLFLGDEFNWLPLREAARCDHCDWEDQIREHGIATPLPQAQKMRAVGRGIALRTRAEIAAGKYDDAVRTLRVGYALSRHMSQGPSLVQSLVGIAIQGSMHEQTLTLIAVKDSPNLYWALGDLASRPIDMRHAFSYESRLWEFSVHRLDELDQRVFSNEEALTLAEELPQIVSGNRRVRSLVPIQLRNFAWALQFYPQAKQYLFDRGYTTDKVESMPVAQVVLLYRWKQYEQVRDNVFKWLAMPTEEAWRYREVGDRELKAATIRGEAEPFIQLLPAVQAALGAQLRAERQTNILRTIEALRMHAAKHGGWPKTLENLSPVPAPTDPYTGKPFDYALKDGVATLNIPPPMKGAHWGGSGIYELTLRN